MFVSQALGSGRRLFQVSVETKGQAAYHERVFVLMSLPVHERAIVHFLNSAVLLAVAFIEMEPAQSAK